MVLVEGVPRRRRVVDARAELAERVLPLLPGGDDALQLRHIAEIRQAAVGARSVDIGLPDLAVVRLERHVVEPRIVIGGAARVGGVRLLLRLALRHVVDAHALLVGHVGEPLVLPASPRPRL